MTGAAGAFGSATVGALRRRGAHVVGLDAAAPDQSSGQADSGPGASTDADASTDTSTDTNSPINSDISCDITDGDQVVAAVRAAIERLGGLDALVHFAGIGEPGDTGAAPGPEASRSLDVNLLGPWRVTAAAQSELVRSRGRVVFVTSELAYVTLPFAASYAVSKRGLTAYADALRLEYGSHLSVTTVYPGYVRTPIHDRSVSAGLSMEGLVRAERVSDIAGTVLRVLTAHRPPRDVAGTRLGGMELWLARHVPARVDAAIRSRLAREIARGRYDGVPLARGLVRRLRRPDDPIDPHEQALCADREGVGR